MNPRDYRNAAEAACLLAVTTTDIESAERHWRKAQRLIRLAHGLEWADGELLKAETRPETARPQSSKVNYGPYRYSSAP